MSGEESCQIHSQEDQELREVKDKQLNNSHYTEE